MDQTPLGIRGRLRQMTSGLPQVYWLLWGGTLLNRLGAFVVPFLTLYLTESRGLSLSQAAFIVSLYGGGAFAANLAGGMMSDHVGRKATMALGLGLGACMMVVLAFSRAYALIAVVTLLLGFFTDLYRPAVSAAIADLVPARDRVRAYGLMYWAINLGAAIAPLLAGFIASRAFVVLFLLDAATTFAYALIILWRVPETKPAAAPDDPVLGLRRRLAVVARDPHLLGFTVLGLLVACIFFQYFVTLPIDMKAQGLTAQDYGIAISVNGALIVLLSIPISHGVGRFRRLRVMAIASVVIGVGFGLTEAAASLPFYAFTVAVWTLGELMLIPVAPSVVADLAPVHLRGLYQGIYGASWGLAALLGPAVGGYVFDHAGAPVLWTGCVMLGGLVGLGFLLLAGPLHRRLEGPAPIVPAAI